MITLQKKMADAVNNYPIIGLGAPNYMQRDLLLKETFPNHRYIDLSTFESRIYAMDDPLGLLHNFEENIILDNIQAAPGLFDVMLEHLDRIENGRIVYGVNFKVQDLRIFASKLKQKTKIFELPNYSAQMLIYERNIEIGSAIKSIIMGNIPDLLTGETDPSSYFSDLISDMIERDIQKARSIDSPAKMITLLRALAASIGTPLDIQSISELCEISVPTTRQWLKVLDRFYIIYPCRPFSRSFGRRNKKTDYIYFVNTGVASRLLNIKTEDECMFSVMRDGLARNAVVSAVLSNYYNRDQRVIPYFWSEQGNNRIDLLIESDELGIEGYKVANSINSQKMMATALKRFSKMSETPLECFKCIHPGEKTFELDNVSFVSWRDA